MKNIDFICEFIDVCKEGYRLGWHERNGGNLSYRLDDNDLLKIKPYINKESLWNTLEFTVDNLKNEYFLFTGSGVYFKNIDKAIKDKLGIIEINNSGDKYRIVWGFENNHFPTSELPTHLLNHSIKKEYSNNKDRVIYHAHPTNIIALTFVLHLSDKVFTKKLWQMATECPVVFPKGVGVLDWMIPGGLGIGIATSEKMKEYNAVIWAHHGMFCAGSSLEETFGLMHTIEKAAQILVKVLSMNSKRINTINDEELLSLEKSFNIKLNRKVFK